jgi:hypothetical protein
VGRRPFSSLPLLARRNPALHPCPNTSNSSFPDPSRSRPAPTPPFARP